MRNIAILEFFSWLSFRLQPEEFLAIPIVARLAGDSRHKNTIHFGATSF